MTKHRQAEITLRQRIEQLQLLYQVITALNEVGARLQTSLEFNRVVDILERGLNQLGFTCSLGLIDSESNKIVTVYYSVDPAAVAQAKTLLGVSFQSHLFSPATFLLAGNGDEKLIAAVFVPDVLAAALKAFPGVQPAAVEQALGLVGLSRGRPILFTPLAANGEPIGVMTIWGAALHEADIPALSIFAAQAGAAIQNARLFEALRHSHKQLAALSHRLVEVQETERRAIARELHDEIGQALTGIRLLLDLAAQSPVSAAPNLTDAQRLVNELIGQVQDLSLNLRPAMLDDLGLLPTLLWHFERYTAQTGIRVCFDHAGLNQRFDPLVETAIYRITQEAITNVARHAGVAEVNVRVWGNLDCLRAQITDRGSGFEPQAILEREHSTGLSGMRERVMLLGGRWVVKSAPGVGTEVIAEIPIDGLGNEGNEGNKGKRGMKEIKERGEIKL